MSFLRRFIPVLALAVLMGCDDDDDVVIVRRGFLASLVSAGGEFTCALTATEVPFCWGADDSGQLGNGPALGSTNRPVRVFGGAEFRSITTGTSHACGLANDGRAFCWGDNDQGQLGDGTMVDRDSPVEVSGGQTFRFLSAGGDHTCGLTTSGQAFCWGSNDFGELGTGTTMNSTVPVAVLGGGTFDQIRSGTTHTCALTSAGEVQCWGSNRFGELGTGSIMGPDTCTVGGLTFACSTEPVVVQTNVDFRALAAGGGFTCAVGTDNLGYCWGSNEFGELGTTVQQLCGTIPCSPSPVQVSGNHTFASITAGEDHACGVTTGAGATFCWGRNTDGQLGNGSNADSSTPVQVAINVGFRNVSAGFNHTCGSTAQNVVLCWGGGAAGQLGNGLNESSNVPVEVTRPAATT